MKKWFLCITLILAASFALADDALRAAQESLRAAGYYTGPIDGELTPATKAALRRYQLHNQLEPTGAFNAETAAALTQETGQLAPEAPAVPEDQSRLTREAQIQLRQQGFYKGEPNGALNPAFVQALQRFQAERGLPVTGRLDIDTLAKLRLLPVPKLPRPRVPPQPLQPPMPQGVPPGN